MAKCFIVTVMFLIAIKRIIMVMTMTIVDVMSIMVITIKRPLLFLWGGGGGNGLVVFESSQGRGEGAMSARDFTLSLLARKWCVNLSICTLKWWSGLVFTLKTSKIQNDTII